MSLAPGAKGVETQRLALLPNAAWSFKSKGE